MIRGPVPSSGPTCLRTEAASHRPSRALLRRRFLSNTICLPFIDPGQSRGATVRSGVVFVRGGRVSRLTMTEMDGRPELEGWLPAYLRDHLAGSVAAVDIARRRRDAEPDEPSRTAIAQLIEDIEEDRARLRGLLSDLGIVTSVWKQVVAAR